VGPNYPRYVNADWDAIIDKYTVTIPWNAQMEALGQGIRYMTDNALILTLFYDPDITAMSARLQNVGVWSSIIWDVQKWDVS
jgi:hypothetical protein